MNVLSAILVAVGAGVLGGSRPTAERVGRPRRRRRHRDRPDADRLGRRHARRPARPPFRAASRSSSGCSSAGSRRDAATPIDAGRPPRPANPRTADRLLVAAAVVTGLSVGNHSLTLLLGPAILLFVLAVEPDILRRPRFVARVHRRLRDPDRARPVRDDPSRRLAPGARSSTPIRARGPGSGTSPSAPSSTAG